MKLTVLLKVYCDFFCVCGGEGGSLNLSLFIACLDLFRLCFKTPMLYKPGGRNVYALLIGVIIFPCASLGSPLLLPRALCGSDFLGCLLSLEITASAARACCQPAFLTVETFTLLGFRSSSLILL